MKDRKGFTLPLGGSTRYFLSIYFMTRPKEALLGSEQRSAQRLEYPHLHTPRGSSSHSSCPYSRAGLISRTQLSVVIIHRVSNFTVSSLSNGNTPNPIQESHSSAGQQGGGGGAREPEWLQASTFLWPPTGRALGPAGPLYPSATSLSHGSMFLNYSRDMAGNLGHGCSIKGPENLGTVRAL